jgi:hypothetical protein
MVNEAIIAALCTSLLASGEVCVKTTEAVGRQVGFYQTIEGTEKYVGARAVAATPKLVRTTIMYGAMLTRFARGGDLRFYFPIPKLCDTVGVGGSLGAQSVDFHWDF